MQFADEAFDILGFSEDEKYDVFKCTAALMHMGNMTKDFVPVGKEEQAEIKDDTNSQKVASLCGIDCEWMITYFCKPKLKVGTEWVQNVPPVQELQALSPVLLVASTNAPSVLLLTSVMKPFAIQA